MLLVVLGKFDLDRPAVLSRLFQVRGFLLEGVAFDVERMMVGEHRQQLSGLHLLTEIDLEVLHLVGQPFDAVVDQLSGRGIFDFCFLFFD